MRPLQSTAAIYHENQNGILTRQEGRQWTRATKLTPKPCQGREVLSFESAACVPSRELFSTPRLSGAAPGKSGDDVEAVLLLAINAVVKLARSGDYQRARQHCAAIVLEAQPIIVARKELLQATLHALFVVRAFRLLARLVMAMNGSAIVEVTVSANSMKDIERPKSDLASQRIRLFLDSRWLDGLSPDDLFLQELCDLLSARHEVEVSMDAMAR
jgi:hypothetical protein